MIQYMPLLGECVHAKSDALHLNWAFTTTYDNYYTLPMTGNINRKSAERSSGTTGEQWTLYWMVEIRFYVVSVLSGHYLTNGSCTGIQSIFIYYHVTLKKPINSIVCCCFVNVSAQCNAGTKNANSPIFECLFNL